jgi:hypothetical protein
MKALNNVNTFFRKLSIYFSQVRTMTMHIKFGPQHCNVFKTQNPHILVGFEPGILCSVGGRDDHYATPSGLVFIFLESPLQTSK